MGRRTDIQTWWSWQSLFAILQTRLNPHWRSMLYYYPQTMLYQQRSRLQYRSMYGYLSVASYLNSYCNHWHLTQVSVTTRMTWHTGRNDRILTGCFLHTELFLITHYKQHVRDLPLKWRKNCLTSPLSDQYTCFTFRTARFRSRTSDRKPLGFSFPSVLPRICQTVALFYSTSTCTF
jgi:hypothetical protein